MQNKTMKEMASLLDEHWGKEKSTQILQAANFGKITVITARNQSKTAFPVLISEQRLHDETAVKEEGVRPISVWWSK